MMLIIEKSHSRTDQQEPQKYSKTMSKFFEYVSFITLTHICISLCGQDAYGEKHMCAEKSTLCCWYKLMTIIVIMIII